MQGGKLLVVCAAVTMEEAAAHITLPEQRRHWAGRDGNSLARSFGGGGRQPPWRLSSACTGNGLTPSRPYASCRDSWVRLSDRHPGSSWCLVRRWRPGFSLPKSVFRTVGLESVGKVKVLEFSFFVVVLRGPDGAGCQEVLGNRLDFTGLDWMESLVQTA